MLVVILRGNYIVSYRDYSINTSIKDKVGNKINKIYTFTSSLD